MEEKKSLKVPASIDEMTDEQVVLAAIAGDLKIIEHVTIERSQELASSRDARISLARKLVELRYMVAYLQTGAKDDLAEFAKVIRRHGKLGHSAMIMRADGIEDVGDEVGHA